MPDAVMLSLAVLLGVVVNRLLDRADKREDWRRQDKVAKDLKEGQDKVAKDLRESRTLTQGRLTEVIEKADEIHALVNSDMTRVLTSNLRLLESSLSDKTQLVAMNRAQKVEPTLEAMEAIAMIEAEISELKITLATRAEGQAAADQVVATAT